MVGWCAGGQYAAACAAVLAERVGAVALVATPAPDSRLRWLAPPYLDAAELAQDDPLRALAVAAELAAPLVAAPGRAGDRWNSPADVATRAQPDVDRALTAMWKEAFRAGARGLAADVVAGSRPWGFVPDQVRAPVALFYGEDDSVIDAAHGRWWARALPPAQMTVWEGSGHLVPFVAWAEILRAVVDER
jgi:pimeloyl-ACP methyl ester carboxylesterase